MKKYLLSNFNIWMAAATACLMLVVGASISYIPKFAQYTISVAFFAYTYILCMHPHYKNISDLDDLRKNYEAEAGENSTSGYRLPVFRYRVAIVVISAMFGIIYFIVYGKMESPSECGIQLVIVVLLILLVLIIKNAFTDRFFDVKKRLTVFQLKKAGALSKALSDKIQVADEEMENHYKYRAKIKNLRSRINDKRDREKIARDYSNGDKYTYEFLYNINKWDDFFGKYYVAAPRYGFRPWGHISFDEAGELIRLMYRIRKENGGADPSDKELLKAQLFMGYTLSDFKKKAVSDEIKRAYSKYKHWAEEDGLFEEDRKTRMTCFNAFLTYYRIAFRYFSAKTEEHAYGYYNHKSGAAPRFKSSAQPSGNIGYLDKILAPLYENCPAFDMKPYSSLTVSEKQRFYDVVQKNEKDILIANIWQKKALNYFLSDRITASTSDAKAYYKKLVRQMSKKYHPDVLESKPDLSPAMKAELSREYAVFNQMVQCIMTI